MRTGDVVIRGLISGAAGVAAMTVTEKIEQVITGRPNSYVPGHTLEHHAGLDEKPDTQREGLNLLMHWGQGILGGVARSLMAQRGVRGPVGSFLFMNLRLLTDQSLENATSVGAPPWTWPRDEQVIDLLEKGVYAFTAGTVADRLVPGPDSGTYVRRGGWKPGRKP